MSPVPSDAAIFGRREGGTGCRSRRILSLLRAASVDGVLLSLRDKLLRVEICMHFVVGKDTAIVSGRSVL